MELTKKLYDQDAYATEFTGKVLSCEAVEYKNEKRYAVILDQTLFFPEEGGQSPDKGTINGKEVVDVQISKDVITHYMSEEVTGDISGKIDWTHRFYNMQQHSGEHIFSGLVHGAYGYDNVGFHLSDQVVTMDFNGMLSLEQALEIEKKANQVIVSNREIEVSYPSKTELADMDYRSKIEIDGQVRIVTIPDIDVCACCAPHVKLTGEIGMLKVQTIQKYKSGVRISILCGFRALAEYEKKREILALAGNLLSAKQDEIPEQISKLKDQNQSLRMELAKAKQEIMSSKLKNIDEKQKDVILFEEGLEQSIMREAVNELVEKHTGICGIFNGSQESGYQFILGSKNCDMREIAKELREQAGAKGGGSEAMIQGSVLASKEKIIEIIS